MSLSEATEARPSGQLRFESLTLTGQREPKPEPVNVLRWAKIQDRQIKHAVNTETGKSKSFSLC